ncbi:MAG: BamA/TamA family outer membrane protein [Myxococcota bacterium]
MSKGTTGAPGASSRRVAACAVVLCALVGAHARAEAPPPTVGGPTGRPGAVSGLRIEENESVSPWLLALPRALLFPPRAAVDAVAWPVRRLAALVDRHTLDERVVDFFFNDERTFGIYPVAFVESGFGPSIGLRLIHTDLLGRSERLWIRAGFGGVDDHSYKVEIDTGDRLGDDVGLSLQTQFKVSGGRPFYGLGNGDEVDASDVAEPLDLLATDTAVDTEYARDELRGHVALTWRPAEHLRVSTHHMWRWREFGQPSDDDPGIAEVYAPSSLVGWEEGLLHAYTFVDVEWDAQTGTRPWIPNSMPSTGWRAGVWAGGVAGVAHDPSRYGRLGFDVERMIDLYAGDRVLRLRLYAEAVVGEATRIPFTDYATLGGPHLLRGYGRDRFRGRLTAVGQLEYRYPILTSLSGFLFVDAGRVWRRFEDLTLEGLRVGFGGGLQVHMRKAFLARIQLAGSIDGGLFLRFRVDPTNRGIQPY